METLGLEIWNRLESVGWIQGQRAFHDDNIGSLSFMFRDHVLTSMHTLL